MSDKKISINDSMMSSTASQRSNKPNTTNPNKKKPVFTPPSQKKSAEG